MLFLKKFIVGIKKILGNLLKSFCIFLVGLYQVYLSSLLGTKWACRFYPTCSSYALKALKERPVLEACVLIFKRLIKCHPFSSSKQEFSL